MEDIIKVIEKKKVEYLNNNDNNLYSEVFDWCKLNIQDSEIITNKDQLLGIAASIRRYILTHLKINRIILSALVLTYQYIVKKIDN